MDKRTDKDRNRNGGFTLVELIVVMAIMAVLAGIAVPSYLGYIKKAKEQQTLIDARQLRIAVSALMMEQGVSDEDITEDDAYMSIFWRTLGDEEHPLHDFYPKSWDPDGTIAEITMDHDFMLTSITYESPDGAKEIWNISDENGSLKVEIVEAAAE